MENAKEIVKEKYGQIADQDSSNKKGCCCGTNGCCSDVNYTVFSESYENLEGYNPDADLNLGCGIPTDFAGIKPGDHVLDLGSGAGNDCFVARSIVGETGKVTGLDLTEQMIVRARANNEKLQFKNVEFVYGDIEEMPIESNLVDVVISNCVLNLVPDKTKAFSEIFRVLKQGGHFCISDVVLRGNLPEKLQNDAEMFAGCVSGAIDMNLYLDIIKKARFSHTTVHKQKVIQMPDELLLKYLSESEIKSFHTGEKGIFSITVSAEKTN
jgi:SAM-dependent methyltransferase